MMSQNVKPQHPIPLLPPDPSLGSPAPVDLEWQVTPRVCALAIKAHLEAQESSALQYKGAEIGVRTATAEEAAKPESQPPAGPRLSKRARRGFTVLHLDATCPLSEIKSKIYQDLGILPPNMDLYVR